jgi:hypothetical protein
MTIQELEQLLKPELENLINQTKEALGEIKKVAISQVWKILQLTIASVIQTIQANAKDISGPDKKIIAMDLLDKFYNSVFVVIDIPFVPLFIEPIIHKYVKTFLMILVGSSIDAMVTTFKQVGVFSKN